MANFIGIDLGTTYSAVSTVDQRGQVKIVHNQEGGNTTPSCVMEDDGKYIVGEEARREWGLDPKSGEAAARFKRDMGKEAKYSINGKEFTPTELSALVLKKLYQDSAEKIGNIIKAVVTIPANFDSAARAATMDAAEAAGLNVLDIINEPTAAVLYYSITKYEGNLEGIYAVYDLGGGTFDISIVRINKMKVEVLASEGDNHFGGDNFDKVLINIIGKKYKVKAKKDMEKRHFNFYHAEQEKKSLTKRNKIKIDVNGTLIELTRKEFEDKISEMLIQVDAKCGKAIESAKVKLSDIKGVFLVGGSTRVPLVKERVKAFFKQDEDALISSVNVDEVVSLGAALYAVYKEKEQDEEDKKAGVDVQSNLTDEQSMAVGGMKMESSTARCFGVIIHPENHPDEKKGINCTIIYKGTKIPCKNDDTLVTKYDNQKFLFFEITESEDVTENRDYVTIVGTATMKLPENTKKGYPIKVTYSYDENQIMHCLFEDEKTGEKVKARIPEEKSIGSGNIGDVE